jgi:hypothetical protein
LFGFQKAKSQFSFCAEFRLKHSRGKLGPNLKEFQWCTIVAIEKKRGKTSLCLVANKKFHCSPEADPTIWKRFDAHFDLMLKILFIPMVSF